MFVWVSDGGAIAGRTLVLVKASGSLTVNTLTINGFATLVLGGVGAVVRATTMTMTQYGVVQGDGDIYATNMYIGGGIAPGKTSVNDCDPCMPEWIGDAAGASLSPLHPHLTDANLMIAGRVTIHNTNAAILQNGGGLYFKQISNTAYDVIAFT